MTLYYKSSKYIKEFINTKDDESITKLTNLIDSLSQMSQLIDEEKLSTLLKLLSHDIHSLELIKTCSEIYVKQKEAKNTNMDVD